MKTKVIFIQYCILATSGLSEMKLSDDWVSKQIKSSKRCSLKQTHVKIFRLILKGSGTSSSINKPISPMRSANTLQPVSPTTLFNLAAAKQTYKTVVESHGDIGAMASSCELRFRFLMFGGGSGRGSIESSAAAALFRQSAVDRESALMEKNAMNLPDYEALFADWWKWEDGGGIKKEREVGVLGEVFSYLF